MTSDELMVSYCKDVLKYFLKMIEITQFSNNINFFFSKKKKRKTGFQSFFLNIYDKYITIEKLISLKINRYNEVTIGKWQLK